MRGVRIPEMKMVSWNRTDAEQRRYRERRGLETPVVYTVNDVCHFL